MAKLLRFLMKKMLVEVKKSMDARFASRVDPFRLRRVAAHQNQ